VSCRVDVLRLSVCGVFHCGVGGALRLPTDKLPVEFSAMCPTRLARLIADTSHGINERARSRYTHALFQNGHSISDQETRNK
jgi:hypothetical protein